LELLEARRRRVGRSDGADRLESQAPDDDACCDERSGFEHELRAKSGSAGRDQAPAAAAKEGPERRRNRGNTERARERLPPLAQVAAGAEEQGFDRRHADAEHFGDLRVAAILDLAHHDRRALVEGQLRERTQEHVE
jgi:hypothetical protein